MKPSVILYKTLPDDLLQHLEEHFSVTQVKNLRPETVSQHAEAFAQAEGLLGSNENVGCRIAGENAENCVPHQRSPSAMRQL
ncbi:hypothetical protein MJ391_27005 [Escherichia coli]|nr:hypothetical protein MJ391_27005 [Escherichia coli]